MSSVRRLVVPASPPIEVLQAALDEAVTCLCAGGLVAFPTETVYGLGAHARDADAVARIFRAKGRPADNPLIVHGADAGMLRSVVTEWPAIADKLAQAFWPGPLTLVLPRNPALPAAVSAGLPSVGVRVPAHPLALALLRTAEMPIAAPSANPYMGVSPTRAEHVEAALAASPEPVLLLDGGATPVGLESTVLDLTRPVPTVLRLGGVSPTALRAVVGEVAVLPQALGESHGETPLPSPGLAKRHYAPRAHVEVLERAALTGRAIAATSQGEKVGVMAYSSIGALPTAAHLVMLPDEPVDYATRLYATLHEMDQRQVNRLLIEAPPPGEAWAAVRDRLSRASTTL